MINIFVCILILTTHWVGDFVFQTDWQAQNKSSNNLALSSHVTSYTLTFVLPMIGIFYFGGYTFLGACTMSYFFACNTYIFHWITDYFTSRLNAKLWADKNRHIFFVSIGFDQLLHFTQLLTTYYLLK